VGLLLPGLQIHLAARYLTGPRQIVASFVLLRQPVEGGEGLAVEPLLSEQAPIVEGRAAPEGEALQEGTSVEGHRLLQLLCGRLAFPTWFDQCPEGGHIHPAVAGGIELDGISAGEEEGGLGVAVVGWCVVSRPRAISNRPTQVGEDASQVGAGGSIGPVGPEYGGDGTALVRAVRLHGQVGQQGADLIGREGGDGLTIQRRFPGA